MYSQTKLSLTETIWQGIVFLAIVYTLVEATFCIAFKLDLRFWQIFIEMLISSIFLADLIRSIYLKKIRKKNPLNRPYSRRDLILDIISSVPFNIVLYISNAHLLWQLIRIIRIFRAVRITHMFSIIGHLTIVPGAVKIPFIVVSSVVAIHCIACGWAFVHPIYDPDLYTHYNKSLYWAITTLTTIGYGDITPTTNISRIFTMMVMILGVGVYGVVIGNFSRLIFMADRYKEQSKEKINDLTQFMKHYNIPTRLQNAVFGFYNNLLTKRLSDNDTQIISELPGPLQDELRCYMNMKLISNIPVFKGCSLNCLKEVSINLEQMFFPPNKLIIRAGEVGDEMFIIGHGSVEVVIKDKGPVATLRDGQFFGESALLEETVRNADIRAQTYCDLYKLRKDNFLAIIKTYPELLHNMEKLMYKRSTDKVKSSKLSSSKQHIKSKAKKK